jgi:hypothetical protein
MRFYLQIILIFFSLFCLKNAVAQPIQEESLEKLIGSIALYPDDLIAIILPAATNPLQLVQADRFLEKRKVDSQLSVNEKWDDPIKSLLNYPEVIKMMSQDLDWTTELGEAVVKDQGSVLDAIQSFRRRTQSVGKLNNDDKQVIVLENEIIKIEPADPQVIYVPQYAPSNMTVSGGDSMGYWPNPYPVYYYPYVPGAALATGLIWGAAINSVWNGGRYYADYGYNGGSANINIDRSNNINFNPANRADQLPRDKSSTQPWKSNKKPGEVSQIGPKKSSPRTADSVKGNRDLEKSKRKTASDSRSSRQNSAFDGHGSRSQTNRNSARGASSRQSMSRGTSSRQHSSSNRSRSSGSRGSGGGRGRR